jgi:hypothetical protein
VTSALPIHGKKLGGALVGFFFFNHLAGVLIIRVWN